ncbi:sulfotransferase [Vibrio sp. TH_r3]|uniref:sulfotransferase family protein n=1 Tax=Vibrio sp. TH_r3 TaxID=3082084 RepID=UPI002954BC54|nr:sulfotransferase [Vibrio sp. TH_r3]MDV7102901.1 sulfotransferase [Vibrio sp. TH_r3]
MAKLCFILGIMPRSGTNYLENIITLHDQCTDCAPIYEDFLVSESDKLVKYAQSVNRRWNSDWEKDSKHVTTSSLLKAVGNGLQQFLSASYLQSQTQTVVEHTVLISKTPSVKNIKNFIDLFPDTKLIILIRDGRSLVESGCRSFNWDFEKACFDWNYAAKKIKKFQLDNIQNNDNIKLVCYENLIKSPDKEVADIFRFLNLPEDNVSVDDIKGLHISGSSEQKKQSKNIDWKPVKKSDDFKPLNRFAHWSKFKARRFEWIAGDSMLSMGYIESYEKFSLFEKILHISLDISWPIRVLPETLKYVILERKLIIKTY